MAIMGRYAFLMHDKGGCVVLDIKRLKSISYFVLDGNTGHCNNASFGRERLSPKSQFPLLYVTECRGKRACYVNDVTLGGSRLVQTIYYDGENGTTTVPVQGVKYFVRGASGKTLVIENAFNFVITADNLMGQTVVLQPDVMGKIEVTVPEDWFTFELIIENVCGEPAVFTMNLVEPGSAAEGDGTPESPFIMTGTEGTITAEFISGFEVVFYSYTATATGTVTFAGTDNMDVFIEDAYGSEWLGTAEATYNVVEGETYRFFIGSADWSAGVAEGTWTLYA
jgi:hypothetical protein